MSLSMKDLEGYMQSKRISLERFNSQCSDDHLTVISRDVDDWQTQAPFFGLSAGDEKAIKRDHDGEELRRRAMLLKWKQMKAFRATYRELASTFLKVKRGDLAQRVCDIIAESEGVEMPSTPSDASSTPHAPPPPQLVPEQSPGISLDAKPLLRQLRVLRSSSGKVVKVKEGVCAYWKDAATQLSFSPGLMKTIKKSNDGAEEAFDDMMERWLNGTEGTRQPISWKTFLEVLQEIDHNTLASDLEKILPEVN